ncbi:hypothetical protein BsWGS_16736 [Bradybaena similaris]
MYYSTLISINQEPSRQ